MLAVRGCGAWYMQIEERSVAATGHRGKLNSLWTSNGQSIERPIACTSRSACNGADGRCRPKGQDTDWGMAENAGYEGRAVTGAC